MRKVGIIAILLLISISSFGAARRLYWNPAANANWNATNAWALTATGTPNITWTSGDTATLTASCRKNCTLTGSATCAEITFTGYIGTFTMQSSRTLTVNGNADFSGSFTFTTESQVIFSTNSTNRTFNPGSKNFMYVKFDKTGGSISLTDNLNVTVSGSSNIQITNGTVDFNDYDVTASTIAITGTAVRTVYLGNGNHEFIKDYGFQVGTSSNITLYCEGSIISFTSPVGYLYGVLLGGKTYNVIKFTGGGDIRQSYYMNNGATIDSLLCLDSPGKVLLGDATYNITSLITIIGDSDPVYICGVYSGTLNSNTATTNIDYCSIAQVVASGTTLWNAGCHSLCEEGYDCTGWIFPSCDGVSPYQQISY
jgi:hypothetical protein